MNKLLRLNLLALAVYVSCANAQQDCPSKPRLVDQGGNEIGGGSPAELSRQIESGLALYGKLIKDAGVKPE